MLKSKIVLVQGRGHWPRKGVWECAAVMTLFIQASWRSLVFQFTINAPLMCLHFQLIEKNLHIQPSFGVKFPSFCSQDPSFFKEN